MTDSLDDIMRGLSFSFFKPCRPTVEDVKQAWELFYASRTQREDDEFTNNVRIINTLDPTNAGIARYALVVGILQGRQYSEGIPASKIIELSAALAGIARSKKQFPFNALEECALKAGKMVAAGNKIDYPDLIINEISYLLA